MKKVIIVCKNKKKLAFSDDAGEVLEKLKTQHPTVKVGLISNFDNRLHDIVPALGKLR
jgi:hypothetical protein